jgi:2-oxoglutarate dehydrogenase E2 component (dihydrolipoamide succinyltransferase)
MSKIEIKVPTVGESVTEVTLSSWLVEDGDYVKLDQPLAEFESDKATFEMPSEVAGVITRVAKEGDDIKIGGLVAYIDTDAAAPEKSAVVTPQSTVDSPQKKEEVKVEEKAEAKVNEEENLKSQISNLKINPTQQAHHLHLLKKY